MDRLVGPERPLGCASVIPWTSMESHLIYASDTKFIHVTLLLFSDGSQKLSSGNLFFAKQYKSVFFHFPHSLKIAFSPTTALIRPSWHGGYSHFVPSKC